MLRDGRIAAEDPAGAAGPTPVRVAQVRVADRTPAQLERWHERAILAVSVAEVFDEATRAA